jgi:WD40 repeat protein
MKARAAIVITVFTLSLIFLTVANGSGISTSNRKIVIQSANNNPKLALQLGHSQAVTSVALSADGNYLVTGSEDKTAKLWQVGEDRELRTFSGHSEQVTSVALSIDGKYLVTGSQDRTAKLWDVESGQELRSFTHSIELVSSRHYCAVLSVAFSADGKYIVTGSDSGGVKLWDVESGQELRSFRGRDSYIYSVALSKNGKYLLASGGGAKLWDVETAKEIRSFGAHGNVNSVAFSANERYVATGDGDLAARLWDLESGKEVRSFTGHSDAIASVALSRDGKYLVTGSRDNTSKLWEIASGKQLRLFTGHSDDVTSVALSADGRYLLTGSRDKTAKIWRMDSSGQLPSFIGHSQAVYSVALSRDNKYLATASGDKTAKLWDMASGQQLRSFNGHSSLVVSVALSFDNKYLATASWDKSARLWDVASGKELFILRGHAEPVFSVGFSDDGKYLATGGNDRKARLWDVENGKEIRSFIGHTSSVTAVDLSNDGKYLLTGSRDNTAKLWDVASGREIRSFKNHTAELTSVALSGNGKYLATANGYSATLWELESGKEVWSVDRLPHLNSIAFSADSKYLVTPSRHKGAILWEVESGKEVRFFSNTPDTENSEQVMSVALSVDNKYLVTGNADGTAKLWESEDGTELRSFTRYSYGVNSAVLSQDGRYLVTGSGDNTAKLWDMASGREMHSFAGHVDDVISVDLSADARYLVTGSRDNTVKLWDVSSGKELRSFTAHDDVTTVIFSGDGKYLVTAGKDKMSKLWEVAGGRELHFFEEAYSKGGPITVSADGKYLLMRSFSGEVRLPPIESGVAARLLDIESSQEKHRFSENIYDLDRKYYDKDLRFQARHLDTMNSIAFSTDSRYLAMAGRDNRVTVCEVESGKVLHILKSHSDRVQSVAFSVDGKYLATGGEDNTAKLWEVASGKELYTLTGHADSVQSVAFISSDRYLVTGSLDGTKRIWNLQNGKELCQLISFNDGNWAVVTREGFFDTSDLEEIKALHWLMPDDPVHSLPLEIFMRDYYEPRLLQRLLSGEKFKETRNLSELNRAQPPVKILGIEQQPKKTDLVTITVEVAQAQSERQRDNQGRLRKTDVYDLRLFRDRQIVGQYADSKTQVLNSSTNDKGDILTWRKENAVQLNGTGRRIVKFENIKLPGKANLKQVEFSAYAFNEDRVKSQTDRKIFNLPADLTPRKGRAYIILFGVNACEAECQSLDYAVNDVRKMQETFASKIKQNGEYEEVVEIPLIADYQRPANGKRVVAEKSATKGNLQTVCDLLSGKLVDGKLLAGIPNVAKLKPARPEDLVMLFFSSHGDTDEQGNFYIVPYDVGQTSLCKDKVITPEEYKQVLARCISSEEMSVWLRYVDAGEMLMIVDACHSAAAVQSGEFKPGPMGSRGLGQLAYDKRMKILAATQGDNVAREFKELNQSLLSYVLTREGIEEERADFKPADQQVTMTEWLLYGVERVPKWYKTKRGERGKPVHLNQSGQEKLESEKRLLQKGITSLMQIPSLFDFTDKRQDKVLIRKVGAARQ